MTDRVYRSKAGAADIAVIAAVILMGILPLALRHGGNSVAVKHDGAVEVYPLSRDRVVEIVSGGHTLELRIEGGAAAVTESDCPDRLCVRHGKASRAGDTIVCVPAGVIIQITGEGDRDEPDAVAGKAG